MGTTSKQERILAGLIVFEIVLFGFTGQNFLSLSNFFECVRLAVEIGLLALAMTPVIVTGGIDLSVGSMMGLCAVVFGSLCQDAHWPLGAAVAAALGVGIMGGALNAALISVLNVSPLIVTLGTYSLFRGLAEGMTAGARSWSNLPAEFLFLGQGYLGGLVPAQTIVFVAAIFGFWLLLHRSVIGRGLYAIGHSAAGARYAAIPVTRRLALVYVLSGFAASVAGIIYVAHLGQAKSDAGTGYELIAITAVVLGGTSIFGGSGTIWGTLLGLAAIVLLQNGLRLSAWPTELAGISTGVLLIVTIALERVSGRDKPPPAEAQEDDFMKNWQLATLCGTVLAGAVIISLSNWYLVTSLRSAVPASGGTVATTSALKRVTVGMMPKAIGDPYFISCRAGAQEAAKQFNVDMIWDGPTGVDAAKQSEVIQGWITRRVDAIAVAVANGPAISSVLRKARAQGIKVVTWDADAEPDARDYFVDQATPQGIGDTLIDQAAKVLHDDGEFAIITGALTAANQNLWIKYMRERVAAKYPKLKLAAIRPSDDDRDKAFSETQTLLNVYPKIRCIVAISAPASPGAAEAVKQAGRNDVKVIGLSLPNLCKPYVHDGVMAAVVLWNTKDLGYLAVDAAAALARGTFPVGAPSFDAGRVGKVEVKGTDIVLGKPFVFIKANIDQFNF
ncbi:MAG TPA: substrate-binding domain-containing protein [Bryobacteraceae bacterium]|nr:substrate-binding domain-containing protein [Bryobacteraceae bacterium]